MSESSGNCLFSSVSISFVGDNSITNDLKLLTCIEMQIITGIFYIQTLMWIFFSFHPFLLPMFYQYISVSHAALDTGLYWSRVT